MSAKKDRKKRTYIYEQHLNERTHLGLGSCGSAELGISIARAVYMILHRLVHTYISIQDITFVMSPVEVRDKSMPFGRVIVVSHQNVPVVRRSR